MSCSKLFEYRSLQRRPNVGGGQWLGNETLALTCIQCVCVCVCVHVLRGLVCGWCALSVHDSPRFCVCVGSRGCSYRVRKDRPAIALPLEMRFSRPPLSRQGRLQCHWNQLAPVRNRAHTHIHTPLVL
jgi:hypothetical protein